MTTHDVRTKFLEYMAAKGHAVIDSAKLVPENDPTTLFTGSGMQPMVPYLLGQKHPMGTRIADSQKCFRSQDIDEVGDNRHTTFFEMLGNWSLGDYFKKEQVAWMYDFLINEVKINPENLYITCFIGDTEYGIPKDEEAAALWKEQFAKSGIVAEEADIDTEENGYKRGIKPGERIFYYEGKKNWWNRGKTGPTTTPVGDPCGPDSEMFYDFGTPHDPRWGEHCHPNCDCGRFMEIGNNVFMTFKKEAEGVFTPFAAPNIDHGSGLERIAAAAIHSADVFNIEVFEQARLIIEKVSGKTYGQNEKETYAFRVILDHLRGATFLISDNVHPSNKDQGYFVRRLIRRSVRFGRDLGINQNFAGAVADAYIKTYEKAYPDLLENKQRIVEEMTKEEEKFRKTLEGGIKQFEKGEDPFILFTTYGFPIELTEELARERGTVIDKDSFYEKLKAHQDLSRSGSEQKFKGGLANTNDKTVRLHTAHHLLLAALQKTLSADIHQRGSNITEERLRIDFSFDRKITPEELKEIENLVNEKIQAELAVVRREMPREEALSLGAEMEFGAKYPDVVSVYFIEDQNGVAFSKEFCGGPHMTNTKELDGTFKILKEEAVSAGVRRIKAVIE